MSPTSTPMSSDTSAWNRIASSSKATSEIKFVRKEIEIFCLFLQIYCVGVLYRNTARFRGREICEPETGLPDHPAPSHHGSHAPPSFGHRSQGHQATQRPHLHARKEGGRQGHDLGFWAL